MFLPDFSAPGYRNFLPRLIVRQQLAEHLRETTQVAISVTYQVNAVLEQRVILARDTFKFRGHEAAAATECFHDSRNVVLAETRQVKANLQPPQVHRQPICRVLNVRTLNILDRGGP